MALNDDLNFDFDNNISREEISKIRKDRAGVIVITRNFRIEDCLHVMPGARMSDLMNRIDIQFLPLTEVIVRTLDGREYIKTNFLSINKSEIVFVVPMDDLEVAPY